MAPTSLPPTSNSNVATVFASLNPWEERKPQDLQLPRDCWPARSRRFARFRRHSSSGSACRRSWAWERRADSNSCWKIAPAAICDQLARPREALVDAARQRPEIRHCGKHLPRQRSAIQDVDLDTDKAQTLGIPVTDVYNALQTFLGGFYVNDFNRFSHTWRVLMQAEPEFRNQPADINRFYVRSAGGDMVPLGTLVSIKPITGPEVVFRYNRFRAIQILGAPAPWGTVPVKPPTPWSK